nr:hypothetical protein [Candidatus Sigynarchaeota archaeon]
MSKEERERLCFFCQAAASARCAACGKWLCSNHDIVDDPYHTGGLLYHPSHWCRDCHAKRQGKGSTTGVLAIIILLGVFIVFLIYA